MAKERDLYDQIRKVDKDNAKLQAQIEQFQAQVEQLRTQIDRLTESRKTE